MKPGQEAAFPVPHAVLPNGEIEWGASGMDTRTWMAGMVVSSGVIVYPWQGDGVATKIYALEVLRATDAILAELEKDEENQ